MCGLRAQTSQASASFPEPFRHAALKATYAAMDIEPSSPTCYPIQKAAAQAELREVALLATSKAETDVVKELFSLIQARALGTSRNLADLDKSAAETSSLTKSLRTELKDPTLKFGY